MNLLDDDEVKKTFAMDPDVASPNSTPPINPQVADYLQQKYPEKFAQLSDEKAKALSDFNTANPEPGRGKKIIAGFLGALGTDPGVESYNTILKNDADRRAAARDVALQPIAQRQKDLAEGLNLDKSATELGQTNTKFGQEQKTYEQSQKDLADSKDKDSAKSEFTRQAISKQFPQMAGIVDGKSDYDIKQQMPILTKSIDQAFEMNKQREEIAGKLKEKELEVGAKKGALAVEKEKTFIPQLGMYIPSGDPEEARKVKEDLELHNDITSKTMQMKALRDKWKGGIFGTSKEKSDDITTGKSLAKDVQLALKKQASLRGAGPEAMAQIDTIVPSDPLAHDISLGDPTGTKLDSLLSKAYTDTNSSLAARGLPQLEPQGAPKADPKISDWAKEHSIPYNQAAKILKSRGYGG